MQRVLPPQASIDVVEIKYTELPSDEFSTWLLLKFGNKVWYTVYIYINLEWD